MKADAYYKSRKWNKKFDIAKAYALNIGTSRVTLFAIPRCTLSCLISVFDV
jgi:hypothetical protein